MTQHDTRATLTAAAATRTARGLLANAFAVVVMLLVQYVLGMWVNLFAALPKSDQGKGTFAGFGAAVAEGPVALTLHALLGTLLVVGAITLVIRAAAARKVADTVLGVVALLAIIGAWMAGSGFVGNAAVGASFGMAVTTAVALLCYVIILFVPRRPGGLPE
jgi:hypothetical protein